MIDNHGLQIVTTMLDSGTEGDKLCAVPTPDELARQAEAVRRVSLARIRKDEAAREYNAAIRAALDAGATVRDIADAAGVSRQWVHKLGRRRK